VQAKISGDLPGLPVVSADGFHGGDRAPLTWSDVSFRITPPMLAEATPGNSVRERRKVSNALRCFGRTLLRLPISFILSVCSGGSAQSPKATGETQSVTIMSFNIRCDTEYDKGNRWPFRSKACVEMIRQINPSVFGIQEGMRHQVDELVANLPEYDTVSAGRDDGAFGGEACAAFFLRRQFTLLDQGTFWLSETPAEPSLGWDAVCRRIVTWVHLQPKDREKPFFLFNTHFDHKGETARIKSAELLVQSIRELTGSEATVFVTGDFNATIENASLAPILEILCDARRTAPQSDRKHSYNEWGNAQPPRSIDHIFYTNAQVSVFKTITEDFGVPYISDHYPIIADFRY